MSAKIILWTVIALLPLACTERSSPIREGGSGGVCNRTLSHQQRRNVSYLMTYRELERQAVGWVIKSRTEIEYENVTVWVTESTCCPGYQNKSGICTCHDGWTGDSCSQSLFCIISHPVDVNFSEDTSYPSVWKNLKDATNDLQISRKRPACRPECLQLVNDTNIKITRSANTTYYFIPIHSSCNTTALRWIYFGIAAVIGIILLFAIVCIICLVQRQRKTSIIVDRESDDMYDYVDLERLSSRAKCNSIYTIS